MPGAPSGGGERVRLGAPFYFSLVTLVVNDHVLKGSGLLPGWLTGKISDFAGLIVAPLVLAALLGARSRAQKLAALTAVTGGFVAVKLSLPVADAVESTLGALGLAWRLWSDPTDLLALSLLPLTWRLLRSSPARASNALTRSVLWLERAGVVSGSLACVATSVAGDGSSTRHITNRTHARYEFRVYHPTAPISCGVALADAEATLGATAFDFSHCDGVEPLKNAILWHSVEESEADCALVVVSGEGLAPTAIFWPRIEPQTDYRLDDIEARLYRVGDRDYLEPAPLTATWTFTGTLEPKSCSGAP